MVIGQLERQAGSDEGERRKKRRENRKERERARIMKGRKQTSRGKSDSKVKEQSMKNDVHQKKKDDRKETETHNAWKTLNKLHISSGGILPIGSVYFSGQLLISEGPELVSGS